MMYNAFNRFQRLFSPDPDGLSARLSAFVKDTPSNPPVASTQDPPAKAGEPTTIITQDPPQNQDPNPDDNAGDDTEDDDEQFPDIGNQTSAPPAADALDEAAFDEETAAMAEGMSKEIKGNNKKSEFDKFSDLRAELKTLKKKAFNPDPESIPEYKALKAEVEDLRKAKEELDGTKARLDAVMKSSDELAVKESPEFISKVREPLAEMKTAISSLAEAASLSPEDLMAIIAEEDPGKQDKALTALESRLPRRTLSRIERFCDDYKVIEQEESRLLADIPKSVAAARKQQQDQIEQNKRLATGQFQESARKSFAEYAHTVPGFTDSAGQLSETAKATQAAAVAVDPHALTPDDLGFMIFASKALPAARKEIKRLQKEVSLLKGTSHETIPGKAPLPAKAPSSQTPPPGQTLRDRMKGQSFTFNPSMVG